MSLWNIHFGIVDGYSRKAMGVEVSNSKTSAVVGGIFHRAVTRFGVPRRVRSDKGGKMVDAATFMLTVRGTGVGAFITGRSVHNQRVERFWGEINRITDRFRNLFMSLCMTDLLDLGNPIDIFSLQYLFVPQIQEALDRFDLRYDCHKIRTAQFKTPNELYMSGSNAPSVSFDYPPPDDSHVLSLPCVEANDWLTHAESLYPNPCEIEDVNWATAYDHLRSSLHNTYR